MTILTPYTENFVEFTISLICVYIQLSTNIIMHESYATQYSNESQYWNKQKCTGSWLYLILTYAGDLVRSWKQWQNKISTKHTLICGNFH